MYGLNRHVWNQQSRENKQEHKQEPSDRFISLARPMQLGPQFALCEDKSGIDISKMIGGLQMPDWVSAETVKPLTGGLTFGGASGLAAGIACKKIGKALAVGVGGLYCLFQVAASYGYITVNWKKVESDVMSMLDTNGDGKLDEKDAGVWLQKVLQVLSNDEKEGDAAKNSATGSFAAAFIMGLKKG